MTQAQAVSRPVSETRINTFLAKVYLLMALGLAITGFVALWASQNVALVLRTSMPGFAFGLFILQIVLVVVLSGAVMKMSPGVALVLFLFYSALTGVTFASLFVVYAETQIAQVFWVTAGVFFLTSMVGLILKKDMSSAGGILFMLLIGWTIGWIFSWFFPSINLLLTYLGIALFVGLTAWDTQRLKQIGQQMEDGRMRSGFVVIGALTLYLDFINLFLLLLRASNR
jgi:FtsH-binding integral membrane protein